MKRFALISFLFLSLSACGTQEADTTDVIIDDPGCSSDCDGGGSALSVAPFRSPAPYVFDFNSVYTGNEPTGEVFGDLPGISWESGVTARDSDEDGWLGLSYEVPAGTYLLNWRAGSPETWADFGTKEALAAMTDDERGFVSCNWWDSGSSSLVDVSGSSCALRVSVDSDGNITAAGNMGNLNPDLL